MVQDYNPPKVSLAGRKISRRDFLRWAAGAGLAGAAAGIGIENKYKIVDGIKDAFTPDDSGSPEHYPVEMDQIEVNCGAQPGSLIHDASKELANIYTDREGEMKASGDWNPDFRKPSYWSHVLTKENPDGFTLRSGDCYMDVPKAYRDKIALE